MWNDALAICKQSESVAGERTARAKLPSNNDFQKLVITQAKKTEPRSWLSDVSNIPLQQSVADLGVAYKNFFDSLKPERKPLNVVQWGLVTPAPYRSPGLQFVPSSEEF